LLVIEEVPGDGEAVLKGEIVEPVRGHLRSPVRERSRPSIRRGPCVIASP
jgi:hypothetical protein